MFLRTIFVETSVTSYISSGSVTVGSCREELLLTHTFCDRCTRMGDPCIRVWRGKHSERRRVRTVRVQLGRDWNKRTRGEKPDDTTTKKDTHTTRTRLVSESELGRNKVRRNTTNSEWSERVLVLMVSTGRPDLAQREVMRKGTVVVGQHIKIYSWRTVTKVWNVGVGTGNGT